MAVRMLGSAAEADDVVQDAWLRLHGNDGTIENPGGWLTTVVARLCLDRLRARRDHAELDESRPSIEADPAEQAALADAVGGALLLVLESLGPAERVAFVLHDVFAIPFDEVAAVLDRSPEATRQLASRARRRVRSHEGPVPVDPVRQRDAVTEFLRAARAGDFEGLLRVLAPDVVLRPDAAALAMGAFPETRGASEVAGMLAGGAKVAKLALVDGLAALLFAPGGNVRAVIRFTVVDGRIAAMDVVADPDRIAAAEIVRL